MLGSGEKIQNARDCETISKSTVPTDLSPFISKVEIALALAGAKMLKKTIEDAFRTSLSAIGSKPETAQNKDEDRGTDVSLS